MATNGRTRVLSSIRRGRSARSVVKLLVAVDLALLLTAGGAWLVLGGRDDGSNVVNGVLHGSRPPAGRSVPALDDVPGLQPAFAAPRSYRGDVLMIVSTCIDCRSGDVIGGFLGRLGSADLPDDVHVEVVAWGGDAQAWRREMRIPDAFDIHVAQTSTATTTVQQRLLDVTDSGRAYLYDRKGGWRSTFHLGQMTREDVLHDLDRLAADA